MFPPTLPRALARIAIAITVLLAAACRQEVVRTAPFRARPDSVEPGNLLGPFDGRVTDAASGDPVAGALVYATWSLQDGYGFLQPAGFSEAVTSTDAGGRYHIDAIAAPEGARIADFRLIIYKRGYIAYRSDRRFSDFGPRRDFAQQNNEVVLDRWRSDLSHLRHLRYVGGGPALAALTAWETQDAVAELDGTRGIRGPRLASDLFPATPAAGRLVAAQVLGEEEIKTITGFEGKFETGPLGDEPDTQSYSSQHFRAVGQPESFDVAVRVWRLDGDEAGKRYTELSQSLPGVEETGEIADQSLRATEGDIRGVAFHDRTRGVVVLITCGAGQCKEMDTAVALAKRAHENIIEVTSAIAQPLPRNQEPTP